MDNQTPSPSSSMETPVVNGKKDDNQSRKGLPKILFFAFIIFDLVVILPLIVFYVLVPTSDINTLKNGHVKVDVSKSKDKAGQYSVHYKIVEKKPKNWVDLKDMDYTAIHAIVISEDWAFYDHSGYDAEQIKEAAEEAIEGERTRGASTISQQLVKNIFLSPKKEISRKVKELGISVYMERNLSKEKILETYLNVIEFGPGIYGIKAAAKHYFNKTPKQLNAREGAFLAMLLPNPRKNSQSFRDRKLTPFAKKRINTVLEKMSVAKYLRHDQVLPLKRKSFNWEAPGSSTEDAGSELVPAAAIGTKQKLDSDSQKKSSKHLTHMNSGDKKKSQKKKRRKRDLTGSRAEARLKKDESLQLEENPEFDEDAIIEDMSGFQSEFSVE